MSISSEIKKRRTFAIISHPDAGKTTLTEKLLLFGGAIQVAGAVKNNKIKRNVTSDFMEIEKQRGISVATSVMSFEYNNHIINILDTPGHKDFAEDTYRTLTAVDSVILVIDCTNGVEPQTEKLMEVCRMRNTPVIIFINKMDREGKDPFILIDELEKKLSIKVRPLSWPINIGSQFKGVYNLFDHKLLLFQANKTKIEKDVFLIDNLEDPNLFNFIGKKDANQLKDDIEIIEGVYDKLNKNTYLKGKISPVFFGSALNNFGIKELLETFIDIAPPPLARETNTGIIEVEDKSFSGFIFKIHANLDSKHRDRIAFLRVCSGVFKRNTFYTQTRTKKKVRFSNPYAFLASSKEILEKAYPGDVIGLYDTGNFKIGDSFTEGKLFSFKGIPNFSPEIFKEVINKNPLKTKQLEKGIKQLSEEGVAQLFIQQNGNKKIIGTVGELQFEVILYRLKNEYNASAEFIPLNFHKATWILSQNSEKLEEFKRIKHRNIVQDKEGNDVFLAESYFLLNTAKKDYPEIEFHTTSEFKVDI